MIVTKKVKKESSGNAIRMGSPMGNSAEPIPISAPHNLIVTPGEQYTRRNDQRYQTWFVDRKIMVHICSKSN